MPQIYINLDYFFQLGQMPMPALLLRLFLDGGWILVLWVILMGLSQIWLQWRRNIFAASITYDLLAINVPRMTEQSPKAVEHIFASVAGTYIPFDFKQKWWDGMFLLTFSFEIVSIEGYIQFLVHVPSRYRDLIEAAVYSQYPDADIVQIADYTERVPGRYPHDEYDIYGFEYTLAKDDTYPLRTYQQFEHNLSEEYFKDPLGGLLEVLGTAKPGEQLWLQILVTPNGGDLKKKSKGTVDEILGKKPASKGNPLWDELMGWPKLFAEQALSYGSAEGGPPKKEEKEKTPTIMQLTPAERSLLESVQIKASKHAFDCKIRMVYVATKEIYHRFRLTGGIGSALGVLTSLDANGLKRYGKVAPKNMNFIDRMQEPGKKNALVGSYRSRSSAVGATPFLLNTEELATLWHFPYRFIKAPSVQKTEATRAEPPASLPTVETRAASPFVPIPPAGAAGAPGDIPLVQDEDEEGEE